MSRLRGVTEAETTPDSRALIAHAEANGAPDSRIVSIYARTPLGVEFFRFWNKLMAPGALSVRLKELVRIFVSVSGECGYCSVVRSAAAQLDGVDEGLVVEMVDFERSELLTAQEKAALRYAAIYRAQPERAADDEVWGDLAAHFDDEQLIELNLLLTLLRGGAPFVKALRLVSWNEVCELKPELQAALQRKSQRDRAAGAGGPDTANMVPAAPLAFEE